MTVISNKLLEKFGRNKEEKGGTQSYNVIISFKLAPWHTWELLFPRNHVHPADFSVATARVYARLTFDQICELTSRKEIDSIDENCAPHPSEPEVGC